MSVIIKRMEMPTTCCNCKFREPFIDSAYCHLAEMNMEYEESDNCRHPDCQLVEISAPHGRLIDADALGDKMSGKWTVYDYQALGTMPTIVEAEDG